MKTAKIDYISNEKPQFRYSTDTVEFCFLGTKVGKAFPQASGWHTCRETLSSSFRQFILGDTNWPCVHTPSLKRIRLGVLRKIGKGETHGTWIRKRDETIEWVKKAKRVLNTFEKKLGWALTTINKVETLEEDRILVYVVSASPKWIRSTQLFSLYLLLFRISRTKEFAKFKNFSDLKDVMDALGKGIHRSPIKKDVSFFKEAYPDLPIILDHHKKLFFKKTMVENFRSSAGSLERYYGSHRKPSPVYNCWISVWDFG